MSAAAESAIPLSTRITSTAANRLCKAWHQVEPDAAETAQRYGAETTVPEWRDRLVCSRCGSRAVDMVVTGTARR